VQQHARTLQGCITTTILDAVIIHPLHTPSRDNILLFVKLCNCHIHQQLFLKPLTPEKYGTISSTDVGSAAGADDAE
jgi:hypothetical protein